MYQYIVVRNPELKGQLQLDFSLAGYCAESTLSLEGVTYKRKNLRSKDLFSLRSFAQPNLDAELSFTKRENTGEISIPTVELKGERIGFEVLHTLPNGKQQQLFSVAIAKTHKPKHVVFVAGSPRSGTTAVGNAVQRAFNREVHGESHLSDIIAKLDEYALSMLEKSPARKNDGTLVNHISPADIQMNTILMMKGLHQQFYGNDLVLDKTPGGPNLNALWLMLKAYPEAKVIYCKRRGIENVVSRVKKFPRVNFEGHCQQWRQNFRLWDRAIKDIRSQLGHDNWWYAVEQLEVAQNPDGSVEKLAPWLNLNSAQSKRMAQYLKEQSPQKSSDFKKPIDIDSVDWSDEDKATFERVCGQEMKKQGYSLDSNYYL